MPLFLINRIRGRLMSALYDGDLTVVLWLWYGHISVISYFLYAVGSLRFGFNICLTFSFDFATQSEVQN